MVREIAWLGRCPVKSTLRKVLADAVLGSGGPGMKGQEYHTINAGLAAAATGTWP